MTMDAKRLPSRALVDSGIVTRALGDMPHDADTTVCRDFYNAMLAHNREILIAAPTIAEIMRKDGKRNAPRVRGIEVVAFDDQAAMLLGSVFPMSVLQTVTRTDGTTFDHLKYDALIVACAVRHNAECIVALDDDVRKLVAALNASGRTYESHHPRHYLAKQVPLPLEDLSPLPGEPVE